MILQTSWNDRRILFVAIMGMALLTACGGTDKSGTASTSESATPTPVTSGVACTVTDSRLTEISGLVASINHPDVLWTHNDSSDSARIFAISASTCKVLADVQLADVKARDVEAITITRTAAGQPTLLVGDIGDNLSDQPFARIYSFAEPQQLKDQSVKVKTLKVALDSQNAEALLADPRPNGSIYVVTKRDQNKATINQLPADALSKDSVTVKEVGPAPDIVTDGSWSPDGTRFVLRGYFNATSYCAPPPSTGQALPIPLQRQGEAIAFSSDGRALYLGSEGANSDLLLIPAPTSPSC